MPGRLVEADMAKAMWAQQVSLIADPETEPQAWQELHSPTEAVMGQISAGRMGFLYKQRKVDKQLRRMIEGTENDRLRRGDAADAIEAAYRLITEGVGVKVQSFARRGGNPRPDWRPHEIDLVRAYNTWADQATRRKLSVQDVERIIVHGETLKHQDRRRVQRRGKAKQHLLEALDLYVGLRWNRQQS